MNALIVSTDSLGRIYEVGPSGQYRYRISDCEGSSAKFGPCEVCGTYANDVHLQTEQRANAACSDTGWTHHECGDLFGHRECLLSTRR